MLEQYPAKAHAVFRDCLHRIVPLPNDHHLSVIEGGPRKFEIALVKMVNYWPPRHELVIYPLFNGESIMYPNTVAEIEEIILTLQKELA
jgi:hypothetical protein